MSTVPPHGPNCSYLAIEMPPSPDGINPANMPISAPAEGRGTFVLAIGQGPAGGFVEIWNTQFGSGNIASNPPFSMLAQLSSGASARLNFVPGQNLVIRNYKIAKIPVTLTFVGW